MRVGKKLIIILIISIIIVIAIGGVCKYYEKTKKADVKIPVLLYHNFVTTVPESDSDNFNYINTPESFEENLKRLLENEYETISFKELNDANEGKAELPNKPRLF